MDVGAVCRALGIAGRAVTDKAQELLRLSQIKLPGARTLRLTAEGAAPRWHRATARRAAAQIFGAKTPAPAHRRPSRSVGTRNA